MVRLRDTPLDSAIVSAIGGVIILVVAVLGLNIALRSQDAAFLDIFAEIVGTLTGILIVVFSSLLFYDSKRHIIYGSLILVLSILSWYGTSGGLFIGFIISVLGGIMGISWHPLKEVAKNNP